jgi:hypothetical protein
LLEGRGPIVTVQRPAQSCANHRSDQRRGGHSGGGGQGQRQGRRWRQLQAVIGCDRVTISSDLDREADEPATAVISLLAGLNAAYALS